MKKTYIKPVVVTEAIHTSSLICTSIGMSSLERDNDVALGREYDFDDDVALGREYDFDDEEEY